MTSEQFAKDCTPEQREAMVRLQERSGIDWDTFLANSAAPAGICPYVGVNDFHGMFVGIEPDGHTHS